MSERDDKYLHEINRLEGERDYWKAKYLGSEREAMARIAELEADNARLRETLDPIVTVAGEQPVPDAIAVMIRDHRAMDALRGLDVGKVECVRDVDGYVWHVRNSARYVDVTHPDPAEAIIAAAEGGV